MIDTETSGLYGFPRDRVFEVGICSYNIQTGAIEREYNTVIKYNSAELTDEQKNAWIFKHSSLDLSDVYNGTDINTVVNELKSLLSGQRVTMYNVAYDLGKFLRYEPFSLESMGIILQPCLMEFCTPICNIRHRYHGLKYPRLKEAWKLLTGKELNKFVGHRAVDDAYYSAEILSVLVDRYEYTT